MNFPEITGGRCALEPAVGSYLLLKRKSHHRLSRCQCWEEKHNKRGPGTCFLKKTLTASARYAADMEQKGKRSWLSRGSRVKGGVARLRVMVLGAHLDPCPRATVWRWVDSEGPLSQVTQSASSRCSRPPSAGSGPPWKPPTCLCMAPFICPDEAGGHDTSDGFPGNIIGHFNPQVTPFFVRHHGTQRWTRPSPSGPAMMGWRHT